jgi:purine-cytosine permease-like protein
MFKEIVNGVQITSARRVVAFMFACASIVVGIAALWFVKASDWYVFIPSGIFAIFCALLFFFTTLNDIKEFAAKIAEALKGKA